MKSFDFLENATNVYRTKSILSSKMFFLNMINVAIAEFTAKTHIIFATNNLTKNLNTFSKIEIV